MIIPFRHTALQVHPLFPGVVALALMTGRAGALIPLLALLLHECGHLLFLMLFRKVPKQLTLTPLGGMLELPDGSVPPIQMFFIALGGPLVSLLCCLFSVAALTRGWLSPSFLQGFLRSNVLLLVFNLLPVLPLDGGRMALSLLQLLLPPRMVEKVLLVLGRLLGALLVGVSAFTACRGELLFAPGLAGLYLCYAAALENRRSPLRFFNDQLSKRQLLSRQCLPVQQLAVSAATPLSALPPRLKQGCYHLLQVVGEDGRTFMGTLRDDDLARFLWHQPPLTAADAIEKQRLP